MPISGIHAQQMYRDGVDFRNLDIISPGEYIDTRQT
jgi:hypothetical protein